MPSIPLTSARAYALVAGFKDPSIILAIAQAESSLNPLATNRNGDGSLDRGILQINNRWHPEVSDSDAFDPRISFEWGFKISSGGTNYQPWSTYQNGAYKQYLTSSGESGGGGGSSGEKSTYFFTPPDFNWIFLSPDLTTTYVPHWARDVQESQSWSLTALVPGVVTDLDDSGTVGGGIGCQIFIIPDAYPTYPNSVVKANWQPSDGGIDPQQPTNVNPINQPKYGRLAWYSYHFLPGTAVVKNGQHVLAGQKLATTSNQGGADPFNHAHVGWFYNWAQNTDAGFRPYGPDILPFLNYLVSTKGSLSFGGAPPPGSGGIGTLTGGGVMLLSSLSDPFLAISLRAHDSLVHVPGMKGVIEAIDESEQFAGIISVQGGNTTPVNPPSLWQQGYDLLQAGMGNAAPLAKDINQDTGDPVGKATQGIKDAFQSLVMTVAANFLPAVVRSILFLVGLTILILLIIRASKPVMDVGMDVAKVAAL